MSVECTLNASAALVLGQAAATARSNGLHQHREAGGLGRAQDLRPLLLAELDLVEVLAAGMAPHHQELGAEELELDAVGAHLEGGLQHLQRRVAPSRRARRPPRRGRSRAGLRRWCGCPARRSGASFRPHPTMASCGRRRARRGTPAVPRTSARMRAVAPPSTPVGDRAAGSARAPREGLPRVPSSKSAPTQHVRRVRRPRHAERDSRLHHRAEVRGHVDDDHRPLEHQRLHRGQRLHGHQSVRGVQRAG